ncbi:MAG: helix-turn-helix domain-containing protein [Elusimicrobiota bacterium]
MGRRTRVSIIHQRGLNQAIIYAGRVPRQALLEPRILVRALRSALRMSQAVLAGRSGVPQAHIARLETGQIDIQLSTLQRLLRAMFCGLMVLPLPRKRPGDALAEQQLKNPFRSVVWGGGSDA